MPSVPCAAILVILHVFIQTHPSTAAARGNMFRVHSMFGWKCFDFGPRQRSLQAVSRCDLLATSVVVVVAVVAVATFRTLTTFGTPVVWSTVTTVRVADTEMMYLSIQWWHASTLFLLLSLPSFPFVCF
jgi:hypothetical protein